MAWDEQNSSSEKGGAVAGRQVSCTLNQEALKANCFCSSLQLVPCQESSWSLSNSTSQSSTELVHVTSLKSLAFLMSQVAGAYKGHECGQARQAYVSQCPCIPRAAGCASIKADPYPELWPRPVCASRGIGHPSLRYAAGSYHKLCIPHAALKEACSSWTCFHGCSIWKVNTLMMSCAVHKLSFSAGFLW